MRLWLTNRNEERPQKGLVLILRSRPFVFVDYKSQQYIRRWKWGVVIFVDFTMLRMYLFANCVSNTNPYQPRIIGWQPYLAEMRFLRSKGLKYKSRSPARRNFTSSCPLPPPWKTANVRGAKTDLSEREKISSHDNYYQGGGGNRKFLCWHVLACFCVFMCMFRQNSH